jgi:hypothetical protein
MWAVVTTSGCTATGYLPAWAESDPSETGVPLERLGIKLADLCHRAPFGGQRIRVTCGGGPGEESEVFWGGIECAPYAEDPGPRIPVANVWLVDDYWIHNLDPDGIEDLAAQLRVQADRLDHEIRPALIAARTDWAERHTT